MQATHENKIRPSANSRAIIFAVMLPPMIFDIGYPTYNKRFFNFKNMLFDEYSLQNISTQ